MTTNRNIAHVSKNARWGGRIISALVVLFLLLDGVIKLVPIAPVTDSFQQLGYALSAETIRGIGVLVLVCTGLYAVPRTSILGAVLLTALMGGGIATHLRAGSPIFTHMLFGVYLGMLIWGGLFLRDSRVRALLPFRRD